jgi:hypothetical protein
VPRLRDANLIVQARLRAVIERATAGAWAQLPAYDRGNLDEWLSTVLPLVDVAQRRSVALTDAYIARALERPALGIDPTPLIGAGVRSGVDPETVYTRPFITLWSALRDGVEYDAAVAKGLHRATSTAAMDVQLSHRASYGAIQAADPRIRGYKRVPDGSACKFCVTVAGAFVKSASAMGLHNHCGCGLEPVTADVEATPTPDTVAVHEHGELGAVLADPAQHFTSLAQLA